MSPRATEIAGQRAHFQVAPCSALPALFDLTHYQGHMEAREICGGCSSRDVCLDVALTDPQANGTYGGALFLKGRRITDPGACQ